MATYTRDRSDPEYRFDAATGQFFFKVGGDERIVGDTDLMIAWSADPESPCLHKHGKPEHVGAFLAKVRGVDPDMTSVTIPWEVISHPEAGPKVLAEINACLAISGRVGGIVERLAAITEGMEIKIYPRDDTPSP